MLDEVQVGRKLYNNRDLDGYLTFVFFRLRFSFSFLFPPLLKADVNVPFILLPASLDVHSHTVINVIHTQGDNDC